MLRYAQWDFAMPVGGGVHAIIRVAA